MTNHTPGPWKVFNAWQDHRDQSIEFTRIGNDEKTVIHAEDSQVEIVAPNEADLHLITVAPELLEELEKTLDSLNAFIKEIISNDMIIPLWVNERKDEIEIIIAKAKGEQS